MKPEPIREKWVRIPRVLWIVLFLVTLPSSACAEIIPANRRIDWSLAGARSDWRTRTTICATLSPSGGNDAPAITNAIAACPQGQVVKLNPGTFKLSSAIVWGNHSNVTLRGSGKTATLLQGRSEEHTSELQSRPHLVCRLLLEKKKKTNDYRNLMIILILSVILVVMLVVLFMI